MQATMMHTPMTVQLIMQHGLQVFPDSRVGTFDGKVVTHTPYADIADNASRLANALCSLGIKSGDRVGTFSWNNTAHMEAYLAIPSMGAIMHTVNIRLSPEHIAYVINHADDKTILLDATLVELFQPVLPLLDTVEQIIVIGGDAQLAGFECYNYETLLSAQPTEFDWPVLDETQAAAVCYTSGTTGNPKGVLYSHRSTLIHTYTAAMPDALNVSARDVVMPVVPMFHVNAWGLPYICSMVGAKLVFPGPAMDGKSLCDLALAESVTLSAGVPTIWAGVDAYLLDNKIKLPDLNRIIIGGSACPSSMIRSFEVNHNIEVAHAWGMTELSPLGTFNSFKAKHSELDNEAKLAFKENQGRVLFGIDMKITDEAGEDLPWDGKTFGDLLVRGPNVLTNYYKQTDPLLIEDQEQNGWFMTGDVATINPDGYMQITDRSKDVIKSGGEWISSIDIENAAVSHPEIIEAGVIAIPHPKWDERPLLVVVKKADSHITKEAILEFFIGKIAKWWIPDDVVFVDEIPHTATGKILKTKLREDFANYQAE